ncbi:MAG: PilZ domain-containing protein [Thermotogaceae bacterium]|nr:PilZ domain-containing protein [Thermotogaceae bacterium]
MVEYYRFKDAVKPGMPILLDISWPEELEGEYKSSVYDYSLEQRVMRIAMPSYKGRLIPLPKGTRIYVKIVDKTSLYTFQGVVLWSGMWEGDNLPSTIVTIPEKVRRVQRRRFNRLPVRLIGKYRKEYEDVYHTFSTIDFSAGGMLMVVEEELKLGDKIFVTMKLKPDLELVEHPAVVRREAGMDKTTLQRFYGVEFQEIDMNLEKKLVRFVMEKEIEFRKKGIIY